MAEVLFSYTEVLAHFPSEVADILVQVSKGRAKRKHDDPKTWKWGINWGQMIRGYGINDILNGKAIEEGDVEQDRLRKETFEDHMAKINQEVKEGIIFMNVFARLGVSYYSQNKLTKWPDLMLERVRQQFNKDKAERERIDNLSPEEKQKEVQSLLGQLGGSPGFMMFEIPTKNR